MSGPGHEGAGVEGDEVPEGDPRGPAQHRDAAEETQGRHGWGKAMAKAGHDDTREEGRGAGGGNGMLPGRRWMWGGGRHGAGIRGGGLSVWIGGVMGYGVTEIVHSKTTTEQLRGIGCANHVRSCEKRHIVRSRVATVDRCAPYQGV